MIKKAQIQKAISKWKYYLKVFALYWFIPSIFYKIRLPRILGKISIEQRNHILTRVDYYNKLNSISRIDKATSVRDYKYPYGAKKRRTKYFFDLYEIVKYFPKDKSFKYVFGDVTDIPNQPSFVKSRPINGENANSVLMKLDKMRHFKFVTDTMAFTDKKDMIVSRNKVNQDHRALFLSMYFGHPKCDIGMVNKNDKYQHPEWQVGYLNIKEQLQYKFIACLEGNDVATNLKWVMSSNSIAVMPKPKYETWYMEGTLIPDYHYIEIKDDYSDLIQKMDYYIENPDKAQEIINHAHQFVEQFKDANRERLLQILVVDKYFNMTNSETDDNN